MEERVKLLAVLGKTACWFFLLFFFGRGCKAASHFGDGGKISRCFGRGGGKTADHFGGKTVTKKMLKT